MKTEPTDLDREAATLFRPAPGMRLLTKDGNAFRVVVNANGDLWTCCECCVVPDTLQLDPDDVYAFDADDDATKGVMLAQVRDATPQIGHRPPTTDSDINGVGRRMWCVHNVDGARFLWCETEGAALVAAMRALKGTAIP